MWAGAYVVQMMNRPYGFLSRSWGFLRLLGDCFDWFSGARGLLWLVSDMVTAFCFKTKLRFASRPSAFCSRTHCDLSQKDIRPPMLDRTDFASWQQRIRLYCRGKDNRVNILKSIDEGPYKLGTFRENLAEITEGTPQFGLPKDTYTLINHYTDVKDIWDNVKMLLEGSELTKEDRESQLYDDFEHFRQHKEELINDYYVRFSKLINDMRNIKMTMPKLQLNSKFVNNMLPEWGRFVTAVKLNRGLRESNYDQLFAYLKQHEAHAKENKMVLERLSTHSRSSRIVVKWNILKQNQGDVNDALGYKKKAVMVTSDPLALVAEKTKVGKRKEKVEVQ
nr:hypothetical protein [Tanacetum cinerariifolium]